MRRIILSLCVVPVLWACKPETAEERAPATEVVAPASSTRPQTELAPPQPKVDAEGLLIPVQGVSNGDLLDSYTDPRSGGRTHFAIDISAPTGTPVLAATDGHIEKLFTSAAGGLTIYQYDPTGNWSLYYAHLDSYAPGLAEGDEVQRGQVIGTVGATGNAPPGVPHLHFAISRLGPDDGWWEGEAINPYPLLRDGDGLPED